MIQKDIKRNQILLNLQGTQTVYSGQDISEGTVIRLVANIKLNKLSPSSTKDILLQYRNENEPNVTKEVKIPINILAQTGFITTNKITVENNSVESQADGEQLLTVHNDRTGWAWTIENGLSWSA